MSSRRDLTNLGHVHTLILHRIKTENEPARSTDAGGRTDEVNGTADVIEDTDFVHVCTMTLFMLVFGRIMTYIQPGI